jgi:hypothetical protein
MKAKRGRYFLRTLFAAGVLFIAACDEAMQASYSSAAAARADGGVTRGWLPDELPDSAFSISESHDLDTNTGSGSFSFGPADSDSFRAKLQPAPPADVHRLHKPDKLQRDGYSFYVVPEFVLAVNWRTRHVHFVLAFKRQ